MVKLVAQYTNDSDLANLMVNAKKRGDMAIWWDSFRRRCELSRQRAPADDPLAQDFCSTTTAYELVMSEARGRNYHANRTWQAMDKPDGIRKTLAKWAVSKKKEIGFTSLIEAGHPNLTGEYLVLKYPEIFSAEVLAAARESLIEVGVASELLPADSETENSKSTV